MGKFNYDKAEADLYDAGCHHPEEIYEYTSEKGFNGFMREHGLKPEKYYKDQPGSGSGSGTEGCYITTACVAAKGLPDNCEELELLRSFRDNYLMKSLEGIKDIDSYYRNAPKVVTSINALPNANEIWNRVYSEMVVPCVEMIKSDKLSETYALYKKCVKELADKYLG